ncbi:MAG: hypothetical protein OXG05_04875 [Gammaproteobacteria bacterium]|nr:hypothetical protein [Gammaproteobacteria bacterium]
MISEAIGKPSLVHGDDKDVASVYARDFVFPVLRHTADLLTILDWADQAVGKEEPYGEHGSGHAPAGMSLAMVSNPINNEYSSFTEAGCEGVTAQIAYKAWLVLIAGLWERFRKSTDLHKNDGPRHGLQTALYGDWQKIRNDVLKNGGVASNGHSGRCELLKWFKQGETIHFKLDHVLEFLHLMGHQLRSYILLDNSSQASHYIGWRMASSNQRHHTLLAESRQPPWRVVSSILMIEEDNANLGVYTLGISLMFADGVSGGFYIERSGDRDALVSRKQVIEQARCDELGCPLVDGIRTNVRLLHQQAKQALENGHLPIDTSSPAMQFGRVN